MHKTLVSPILYKRYNFFLQILHHELQNIICILEMIVNYTFISIHFHSKYRKKRCLIVFLIIHDIFLYFPCVTSKNHFSKICHADYIYDFIITQFKQFSKIQLVISKNSQFLKNFLIRITQQLWSRVASPS